MKKIITWLTSAIFLTSTSLTTLACSEEYLEITNEEIYSEPGKNGKIDNIAFTYMYALPKNEKPDHNISSFYNWSWNLENRKEIIGFNHAKNLDNQKTEYWKIILKKTKEKGIFIKEHKKSYEEIK